MILYPLKTKRAIERNVEIIGEAINSREIVNTRNWIIHCYDSVSEKIIWSIVVRDLPKLENEFKGLLEDAG